MRIELDAKIGVITLEATRTLSEIEANILALEVEQKLNDLDVIATPHHPLGFMIRVHVKDVKVIG